VTPDASLQLPTIDEIHDLLHSSKVLTTVDLDAAYHNIEIPPEDYKYSSFVTPDSQLVYKTIPQGSKRSPAAFCQVAKYIFDEFIISRLGYSSSF